MRRRRFLANASERGGKVALLDIPLLLETGGDRFLDLAIVVSASLENQRARALSRPNMNVSKLDLILRRQLSDTDKRRRAHFVIDTNGSVAKTIAQAAGLVRAIPASRGKRIRNARNSSRH